MKMRIRTIQIVVFRFKSQQLQNQIKENADRVLSDNDCHYLVFYYYYYYRYFLYYLCYVD